MNAAIVYRQCRLLKPTPRGRVVQVSWIPAEFARSGRVLRLRDDAGTWDNGWVVERVGAEQTESEFVAAEQARRRFHDSTKK